MSQLTRASSRTVIGRIGYLNIEPFFEGLEHDAEQRVVPPRELARLCREGEVDAGALPVAELFRMEEEFEPLGELGIAAEGRVRSVLLFSRRPLDELTGARIGLTQESSTSVRLLRLLLEERHRVRPAGYARGIPHQDADAFLAIGDAALILGSRGVPGFPHVSDLAEEWRAWQGTPFVFARWAVRRSLPEAEKSRLAGALSRALDRGLARAGDIAARYVPELQLPSPELEDYLRQFHYRLGREEARGERLFRRMLDEHDLAGFDPR